MKTKQLANVLIKILGLSILIGSITRIFFGQIIMSRAVRTGSQGFNWPYVILDAIVPVIAICLIVKSRAVAEFLFKNEEE